MNAAAAAADRLREAARETLGSFVADIREGKSAAESMSDALDNLADRMLSRGLDQLLSLLLGGAGTTGTGILGGLFGGARAAGGDAYLASGVTKSVTFRSISSTE